MRPLIGISSNFDANQDDPPRERQTLLAAYVDAVQRAGGLPVALPVPRTYDESWIDDLLARIDGLILSGGNDLDAARFGETMHPKAKPLHPRREPFEIDLFRAADRRRLPMFCVCLGHQVAHVARGGGIIQHIESGPDAAVAHYQSGDADVLHGVSITPGSHLAELVGAETIEVASRHHQVVDPRRLGAGLRTVATSADGHVEASEDFDGRWLLTVQWHPEALPESSAHQACFAALIETAAHAATASRA
ncbi:MAG: gamma-glutamyl-gamma-aminobutyrate hydrolase family protein [Planctomycetota bacterium]|nr:MAG: gamma-glutamyl-gamma-aminobutyrate hydrolase family protein [Planctomycetota bacterium]